MKRIIFAFILIHIFLAANAQENRCVVVDETGAPLAFANVVILNAADSTMVTGGITDDDGIYYFHSSGDKEIMMVSMMGYESRYLNRPYPAEIQLKSSTINLEEVVVKGSRKYVEPTNTGLVVKMEHNPLSQLPSIADAIKQMPMINPIDGTVLGKGQPEIYINNRKVRDQSELGLLSADKVIDVEIITSPGSKYDSNVRSVIIVHTRKLEQDFAGIVTGTGTASEVLSGNVNADLSYMSRSGVGIYGGLVLSSDGYKQEREYDELFNGGKSHTLTQGTYRSRSESLRTNLGMSYDFSPESSIGIRYEFNRMPKSHYTAQSDVNIVSEALNDVLASLANINSQNHQHSVNAYSDVMLGAKKIFRLTADADYISGGNKNHSATTERGDSDRDICTDSHTSYSLAAAKVNLNMSTGKWNADFGAQYSYTANDMSFDGSDNEGAGFLNESSDSERQNLYAGYASVSYSINDNWSLAGGLRLEHTGFDYEQDGVKVDEQSKTYTDLLPTLEASYRKGNWALGLRYASNISRPSYSDLNNNYTYVSHTSWETGNPLLKPSKTHSLNMSVSWKQTYFNAIFSRNVRNINTVYTYLQMENVNVRQEVNLPDFNSLTLVASQSWNVGLWHPMIQGVLYLQDLEYGSPEESYKKPLGQITLSNRFDLPWSIYGYLGGSWTSKGNQATLYSEGSISFYCMLSKSLKNWRFNVMVNDFTNSYRQKNVVETNGVSYGENRKGASRMCQLSVTYTFKNKKAYKGKSAAGEELNRF